VHADWRHHLHDYTPAAAERLAAGSALPASDYVRSLRVRHQLQARCRDVFDAVDVMLTPATPGPAPRVVPPLDPMFFDGDRMWLESVARYLIPFNLVGLPALVVPSGHTPDGRPTGVQIVGGAGDERAVLTTAAAFQSITDHHTAAPPARPVDAAA
jgi:aspartyl-tRNA(Asn)/glutamyl-tRNA(Gln) amidotransferase subunit A